MRNLLRPINQMHAAVGRTDWYTVMWMNSRTPGNRELMSLALIREAHGYQRRLSRRTGEPEVGAVLLLRKLGQE